MDFVYELPFYEAPSNRGGNFALYDSHGIVAPLSKFRAAHIQANIDFAEATEFGTALQGMSGVLGLGPAIMQVGGADLETVAKVSEITLSLEAILPGGKRPLNRANLGAGRAGQKINDLPAQYEKKGRAPKNAMEAGKNIEAKILAAKRKAKNNKVDRPNINVIDSPIFKEMAGNPKYTTKGKLKGVILDSKDGGFLEIKVGKSQLSSTYQLRLQTYLAKSTNTPFTINTSRPINPTFQNYLDKYGVYVDKLN